MGIEESGEIGEREGGVVGTVEGVGIEVEDGFVVSGGGGSDHGFWYARADDDEVEIARLDWRV